MGFFHNDLKREVAAKPKPKAPPRGHIPIESLNKLRCSVCPNDKADIDMPKPEPEGNDNPLFYFLGSAPTGPEDEERRIWTGPSARELMKKSNMGKHDTRYSNIVNCWNGVKEDGRLDVKEIECCRPRVIDDIECTRPLVVIGIGDDPLHWATGLPRNAPGFRGTPIAAKFGKHVCWYYPMLYPNYTNRKKGRRTSEYELTTEHDLAYIEQLVYDGGLQPPTFYDGPYDTGIEMITGQESGDFQRLEDAFQWLLTLPHFGMDYETSGIKPHDEKDPKIWTVAVGSFERTIAFPMMHLDGWGTDTRMLKVKGMFGEFLMQSGRKRCHNAPFEQSWSVACYGPEVLRRTEWDDTMAMAHTFDERKGIKSLDFQCRVNFGFFLKSQSQVDVSIPNWINQFSLKQVLRYNGMDSKWTDKLADVYIERLEHESKMRDVYKARMAHTPTLVLTTDRGLPIDFDHAEKLVTETDERLRVIEDKIRKTPEVRKYTAKYGTFSVTAPEQVLVLMRDVLDRKEVWKEHWDGSGKWTTDEEALMSMDPIEVPSAPLIIEHRGLERNNSTYLEPLLKGKLTGVDGMNHSEYGQLHTVTGRINSPMHNWPKRKHKYVRGVVSPPAGVWVVPADYGQIEFRVAGMLSEDQNLVKYCWTGYDVHKYWAERLVAEYPHIIDLIVAEFEIDWEEKGIKTLRQEMKNKWVFPQIFGSKIESCATNLHIPLDVAEDLGREFWDEFRGVKKWQERTIEFYEKNLYVETLGGIRRRGPTTVNELINMPIQGTACEIVLAGMDGISERAELEENIELQPAFNGHDDLTFFISDEKLEASIEVIAYEMCKPRFDYINVPLLVEVSVGARWDQCKELAVYSSADLFNLRNPYK